MEDRKEARSVIVSVRIPTDLARKLDEHIVGKYGRELSELHGLRSLELRKVLEQFFSDPGPEEDAA